jgi:uncharacterized membrane protein
VSRAQQPALLAFAIGLIGLGVLALIFRDFAMGWQPVAPWFPARTLLAYGSGVLMLVCGAGLLLPKTVKWSARILFPYLVIWAFLKVPALFVAPKIEGVWLGIGELTMLLSGGWVLFATLADMPDSPITGTRGLRIARYLFGISVLPVGLSHLFYTQITAGMVPAWMPAHTFLAYFTGIGQMLCGLGVLLPLCPAVAAYGETLFVGLFTLLLWLPAVVREPKTRLNWTAFFISWIIGSAAWLVAQSLRAQKAEA